jgi:hypothetical protein
MATWMYVSFHNDMRSASHAAMVLPSGLKASEPVLNLRVLPAHGPAVSPDCDEMDAQTGGNRNSHACGRQVRTLTIELNAAMFAEEMSVRNQTSPHWSCSCST